MSQNGEVENAGLQMIIDIYLFQYQHLKTKFEYTRSGKQIQQSINNECKNMKYGLKN